MGFNVNLYLAKEIDTPAIFNSGTTDIHACVDCLNRHEIHRCNGTRRYYWDYCEIHAPAYEADQVDQESQATLSELREGILHGLIKKPPVLKVARPSPARGFRGGLVSRYNNARRSTQTQGERHDPRYSSYMNDNKVKPIWPSVLVHYKHTNGCIHGENVEFKAFMDDTLVQHSCGGRDPDAKAVLQQDKEELITRGEQNFWEMQKHGRPTFKRSSLKDGIRVYFKRCNGQFVDVDGYALPTTINQCDVNTTVMPTIAGDDKSYVHSDKSETSLLDAENKMSDLIMPIEPNKAPSNTSCPSLVQDTDDMSLEIFNTTSWKETMDYYSTEILPHHKEEWTLELEHLLASTAKQINPPPLLPDFAPECDSHNLNDATRDDEYTIDLSSLFAVQKGRTSKNKALIQPEPKVSLTKLMSREQSVYCNHTTPESLIIAMYHLNDNRTLEAREKEAAWRRQLYVSGNLRDDPLLEK